MRDSETPKLDIEPPLVGWQRRRASLELLMAKQMQEQGRDREAAHELVGQIFDELEDHLLDYVVAMTFAYPASPDGAALTVSFSAGGQFPVKLP